MAVNLDEFFCRSVCRSVGKALLAKLSCRPLYRKLYKTAKVFAHYIFYSFLD